jgi:acyl carrier protein
MNTIETLVKIVATKGPVLDVSNLTPQTDLKDMGIDSLTFLELIYNIEMEYNITIPTKLLPKMDTVQGLVDAIERSIVNHNE